MKHPSPVRAPRRRRRGPAGLALVALVALVAAVLAAALPATPAAAGRAEPVALGGVRPGHLALDASRGLVVVTAGDRYHVVGTDGVVRRTYTGKNDAGDVVVLGGIAYILEASTSQIARIDLTTLDELTPLATGRVVPYWMVGVAGGLWVSVTTDTAIVGARVDVATGALTPYPGFVVGSSATSTISVNGTMFLDMPRGDVWDLGGGAPVLAHHLVEVAVNGRYGGISADGRTIVAEGRGTDGFTEIAEWDTTTGARTGRRLPSVGGFTTRLVLASGDGASIFRATAGDPSVLRIRTSDLSTVWSESRGSGVVDLVVAPNGIDAYGLSPGTADAPVALHLLPSPPPPPAPIGPGAYHALTPARILDTRDGIGAPPAAVGPHGELRVRVTGVGGVPASRVSAVVLNLTATAPTAGSFVTVWPAGVARPTASSLNFGPGETVPNLVTTAVGDGGAIVLANDAGSVHLVADVVGWYDQGSDSAGAVYQQAQPVRVLDTRERGWVFERDGVPTRRADGEREPEPVHEGERLTVRLPQVQSATAAAIVNITVTDPTTSGYLTVWPTGTPRPTASNLNFVAGQVRANLAIVGLGYGTSQQFLGFDLVNAFGDAHVVVDLLGWFVPPYANVDASSGSVDNGRYTPITPTRLLDTRRNAGGLGDRGVGRFRFPTDLEGSGVEAYALNVTVTGTTQPSFLSMWPSNAPPVPGSILNWGAGQTVPNHVIMTIPLDGNVLFFNLAGHADVIVDVVGVYWR